MGAAAPTPVPAGAEQPLLRARGLTVQRGGRRILSDVSFDLHAGRTTALIGPNGAGKTTLLDAICGATAMQAGELELDGQPVQPTPATLARLGIARTFQSATLDERHTVRELIAGGAAVPSARTAVGALALAVRRGRPARDDFGVRERTSTLLRQFGLEEVADERPDALPHATRQRTALARALISAPRLLLLDEPAGGLGRDEVLELGRVLATLRRRTGIDPAVLFVEHHVEMVMEVASTILVLDGGRIVASGSPEAVGADERARQAYLGPSA